MAAVLIVGAGPTGLALACELYRRGVACRVVEAAAARGTRSKAIAIWPRVLEILADLGAAEPAVDRGIRLHGATVWSNGRPVFGFRLDRLPSRYPFGLVLPQYETEEILEARLADLGGTVEHAVSCVDIEPDGSGATAVLREAGRLTRCRADWVVGCDGAGSVVRRAAGIRMRQRLEPEGWIAADVRLDTPLAPTGVNYFLSRGRVLHVVPLLRRGGRSTWRITMNVGQVRPEPADWPLERLARAAAERAAVPVVVTAAEWVTGFRVRQGLASRFRAGRVLVAGDAAHVHSPAGAQGINSGLQDAANLGWKLAEVCLGGPAELLSTYDAERRPAARTVVRATDRGTRLGTLRSPVAVAARDLLWSAAGRRGLVDRYVAPAMAGLTQRYRLRGSVAGRLTGRSGVPGPGSRLPDVDLGHAWLWELLPQTGSCVVLLGLDPGGGPAPKPAGVGPTPAGAGTAAGLPVVVVADPERRAHRALRVTRPTALLVRPDRYIAERRPATEYLRSTREQMPCPVPETPSRTP